LKRVLVIMAALVACTNQNVPAPSPSPTSPALSQAADLRTRMDLLMSEQVMIVAKETAAAVNHANSYTAYASLLALNSADLSGLMARAFGNTAGVEYAQAWNVQNGFLVDYAIGVVTHNTDKANAAMKALATTFTPQFAQLITTTTNLPNDPTTQLIAAQIADDKVVIDDVFTANFTAYYSDLHRAYAHTSQLADLIAEQIAIDFPDKYPGDPSNRLVDARAILNLDLQEHSYLATLATDATLNHRDTERSAALHALSTNTDALRTVVEDSRFALALTEEISSLQSYALSQDPSAKAALTETVASQLAAVTGASTSAIAHHEEATIQVVDDQRSGAPTVADDDRSAATSMQPIADSIKG